MLTMLQNENQRLKISFSTLQECEFCYHIRHTSLNIHKTVKNKRVKDAPKGGLRRQQ